MDQHQRDSWSLERRSMRRVAWRRWLRFERFGVRTRICEGRAGKGQSQRRERGEKRGTYATEGEHERVDVGEDDDDD